MLPFRKMSLLLVNTRARTTFLVAIYTVMKYNGEKNKIFDLFDLFRKIEPLIFLVFSMVCRHIEIFLI